MPKERCPVHDVVINASEANTGAYSVHGHVDCKHCKKAKTPQFQTMAAAHEASKVEPPAETDDDAEETEGA